MLEFSPYVDQMSELLQEFGARALLKSVYYAKWTKNENFHQKWKTLAAPPNFFSI